MSVLIENQKDVYLNLPPLLFAILYDQVTTLSSSTPESPWTISRLTSQLSSLSPTYISSNPSIPFSSLPPLKQIKISLFRRVLTYPLYRSLSLAEKVWSSVANLLFQGRRAIIRILLQGREILMEGDWSVFSRVWLEDYIIWSQSSSENVLTVLAQEMLKVTVEMEDIGFELNDE